MSRQVRPKSRGVGDPFGTVPAGSWVAPVLSGLGLVVVFLVTISLLGVDLSFGTSGTAGSGGNTGNAGGTTDRTPTPSNVVLPEPEAAFEGSIVYAKAGNIWVQTGDAVRQLTSSGADSMPSWSPDGTTVYYIQTTEERGLWPTLGKDRHYLMTVPNLMSVAADGSSKPERLRSGKFRKKGKTWFYWMRQPVMSPDGKTFALVSDGPDPTKSNVILQFWDPAKDKTTIPKVSEVPPLGHQDPAWRPDGKMLLYVRNGREGAKGAPVIYRWDVVKKTSAPVTGPGYLEPSYSPDGKYITATRIDAFGSDIVILDANGGRELLRVTNDDASWAPVWSPAGDAIAFFHIDGQIVDLRMAVLDGTAPNWTIKETKALTTVSGLDGSSRPDWFIPADLLPAPPTPSVPVSAVPSAAVPSAAVPSSVAP